MSMDYQEIAKKSVKVAGAFVAATGVVALSAVVASGAAVGALVEGFKSAGKTMKKVIEEEIAKKQELVDAECNTECETVEEAETEMSHIEVVNADECIIGAQKIDKQETEVPEITAEAQEVCTC